MVRQIFNEIVKHYEFTPEACRKVRIKVRPKKWRWRCRKLLPTMLYGRLFPRLDQIHAADKAMFRSSYPTTEHLATYKMIDQRCHEWREKCGLPQSTSWKHSTPSLTNQFGTPSNLAVSIMNTSISWETVQWPESHNVDRRRKWHVRFRERNQAKWSIIKLALQHNSAESIVRRHSALAKEKRNEYLLRRQR